MSFVSVGDYHPEVRRAIAAAQATFPQFARHVESECIRRAMAERLGVAPIYDQIYLKALFVDPVDPNYGEHLPVTSFYTDGKTVTGVIAEDATSLDLRDGQEVSFPVERISDWLLVRVDGLALGGFTIDVMARQMTEAERAAAAHHPPYRWYRDRAMTAVEQLESVPVCRQCGQRDLTTQSYRGDVCGLCSSGARRCDCTRCGAPIFRGLQDPQQCYHCLFCL
jgi:uncharacterized protein YegJ (DUF2314 family)